MAFGVSRKVSYDISTAFGKGLNGLKFEAMANQKKPKEQKKLKEGWRRITGRAILETILLGIFTLMVAAVPLLVTRVPAPESVIRVKEIVADWCTPSICFVVLIVGVMVATSGVLWGAEGGSMPEQNKFTETYLIQRPVSASQLDPLRMPDIFFSADSARAHALSSAAAATFPVRVAQPTSVIVPVYYPAFIPPHTLPVSHDREMNAGVERYQPNQEGRFESRAQEKFEPQKQGRYVPDEGNEFEPEEDDKYEVQVDNKYIPDDEARSEPEEDDARHGPAEQVESEREDEAESEREEEGIESDADDEAEAEPQVESKYDSEDEVEYKPEESSKFEVDMQPLPSESHTRTAVSPLYSPPEPEVAPAVTQFPPMRHGYSSTVSAVREPETPSPSLLSRRRPPTVPAPAVLRRAPQPAPVTGGSQMTQVSNGDANSPINVGYEPKLAVHIERKVPVEIIRSSSVSPQTPPEHARRPSSSSSRSYAEFVRRTSNFSPRTPVESVKPVHTPSSTPNPVSPPVSAPRVPSPPETVKPDGVSQKAVTDAITTKTEAAESEVTKATTERVNSTPISRGVSVLSRQSSLQTRRPREVKVVNDDEIDTDQNEDLVDDDVDQRVEVFLRNFREQMRLQRQESLQRNRTVEDLEN